MELNKTILESNYEIIEDGIKAVATPNSNLFVDPYSNESVDNAPFFYEEVTGDFVLKARVSHDFVSTYDACVLHHMAQKETVLRETDCLGKYLKMMIGS